MEELCEVDDDGWSVSLTPNHQISNHDLRFRSRREGYDMGSISKMTKAELRQRERDQQAPEYLEWLSRRDADLERFLTEDVPEIGALDNPWSAAGLQLAGEAARSIFGATAALSQPEHLPTVDRFTRYIGEVYVRTLEGEWRNDPDIRTERDMRPVISEPYRNMYLDPDQQLWLAFVKATEKEPLPHQGMLVWVFENSKNNYEDWTEAGRPSFDEWTKIQLAQICEREDKYDEEWFGAQPAELARFLSEDVPEIGALDDPWSPEGLRLAEEAARVRFGGRTALLRLTEEAIRQQADALHNRTELVLSDDIAAADRFFRYIGEVYVRNGAKWEMRAGGSSRGGGWPVINTQLLYDGSGERLDPHAQLLLACRTQPRANRMPVGELAWEFTRRITMSRRNYGHR